MRGILSVPALFAVLFLATGCRTYQYRILQPAQAANTIVTAQPVAVHYEPLDYHFARSRDRLAMRISNPTDDQIILRGDKSFIVDPRGESHPVPGFVIGPHSYSRLLLPPRLATAEAVGYTLHTIGFGEPAPLSFILALSATASRLNMRLKLYANASHRIRGRL
jgi:hypothetical protein